MEEPLFFASEGFHLFGVLHLPGGATRQRGIVLCHPFAEEQKQGYRVFVELARRLARAGFPCLRFDYRGTGDSSGSFSEFSLSGAVRDIRSAAALLAERTGCRRLGLVGLRLGGSLAWRALQDGLEADRLVLWHPVLDGKLFYRLNLRRSLVRQMLTAGKASGVRESQEAATVDLDGFVASRAMCDELKELALGGGSLPSARVLIVQFARSAEPAAELRDLVGALREGDAFLSFAIEPFWNRLGYVDCSPAIEATARWLEEEHPA